MLPVLFCAQSAAIFAMVFQVLVVKPLPKRRSSSTIAAGLPFSDKSSTLHTMRLSTDKMRNEPSCDCQEKPCAVSGSSLSNVT